MSILILNKIWVRKFEKSFYQYYFFILQYFDIFAGIVQLKMTKISILHGSCIKSKETPISAKPIEDYLKPSHLKIM